MDITLSRGQMIAAFNRYLDEYNNNPEGFKTFEEAIAEHRKARGDNEEPSYGRDVTDFFLECVRLNHVEENGSSG